jgi:predicted cupin superfamily sugar epimerase
VAPSYSSALRLGEGALPGPLDAERPVGTALYFLVTPAAPVRLHRIRNDQLYHYYLGGPLEIVMMLPDGTGQRHVVGPDLLGGQHVQLFIPGGTFHTARLLGDAGWFLGGSTEWPGVVPADVQLGDADELAARYPDFAEAIRTFPVPR